MPEWYGKDKVFLVRANYGRNTHLMTWTAVIGHKHTVCGLANAGYDWKTVDEATDSRPMCPQCVGIAERACVQLEPPKVQILEWHTLDFPSAISLNCPHCRHIINVPEEGLPGRCPVCGYWHLLMGTRLAVSWEKLEYMPNA